MAKKKKKPDKHPASVFRKGANVTFLDLPAEIRLKIYGCILEEPDPIHLRLIMWQHRPREVARIGADRIRHHRGEVYDRSKHRWIPAPPAHTAIMFSSNQVYTEASQALYGGNTFRFESFSVVLDFLQLLGPRSQYIRFIEIEPGGWKVTKVRPALKLLCQAKGLRRLELSHLDFCHRYRDPRLTVQKIASACKGLLKALRRSYQAQNLTGDVLDVVQITALTQGPCRECSKGMAPDTHGRCGRGYGTCNCLCSDVEKNNADLCAKLRSLIAKDLGIGG